MSSSALHTASPLYAIGGAAAGLLQAACQFSQFLGVGSVVAHHVLHQSHQFFHGGMLAVTAAAAAALTAVVVVMVVMAMVMIMAVVVMVMVMIMAVVMIVVVMIVMHTEFSFACNIVFSIINAEQSKVKTFIFPFYPPPGLAQRRKRGYNVINCRLAHWRGSAQLTFPPGEACAATGRINDH